MKKLFARIYQKILYVAMLFIKFREPIILDNYQELVEVLSKNNKKHIMLLSGKRVSKEGFYQELYILLNDNFNVLKYTDIPSDPDIESIENAVLAAKEHTCDAVVAIGGGSTMDAAKAVAARLNNPNQSLRQMRGIIRIKRKPVFLVAIPTTAGTGSECTVASVVSDLENKEKYAISDPKLIPIYAVLNPKCILTLPKDLLATTALDALTHAVEAYLGCSNTKETKQKAISACKNIFNNLEFAYNNLNDLESRRLLQIASYDAGIAFTKAYVGYVHAFSHAIAAYYHLPHGYLNGIILPIVLESYGEIINKKLVTLLSSTNLDSSDPDNFIIYIKNLLVSLNIQNNLCDIIKDEDIPKMIEHIKKEVYPLYPVPRYFSDEELLIIFNKLRNIA